MEVATFYQFIRGAPISLLLLLAICISSIYGFYHKKYFLKLILHPLGISKHREYYRLFTSDLIHNDFGHLLVNAYMYCIVCINLEHSLNQKSPYGSELFVIIYGFSYFTGVFVITLRHKHDINYSSAGASGSIMGCMMSFMILKPDKVALYLPVYGGVKNSFMALLFIIGLIVYQYRSRNQLMNNELHFFSALGGIGITIALFPELIL
jgi:membrane associated rhomboid family serine protease